MGRVFISYRLQQDSAQFAKYRLIITMPISLLTISNTHKSR